MGFMKVTYLTYNQITMGVEPLTNEYKCLIKNNIGIFQILRWRFSCDILKVSIKRGF